MKQIILYGIVWCSQNICGRYKHVFITIDCELLCIVHQIFYDGKDGVYTTQILLMAPDVFIYQFLVEFVSVPNFWLREHCELSQIVSVWNDKCMSSNFIARNMYVFTQFHLMGIHKVLLEYFWQTIAKLSQILNLG